MRIGTLRRGRRQEAGPGVAGTARLDRRTKNLTKRLRPGDIAVIDHVDIDRVSADALVGCKVGRGGQRRAEHLRPLSQPRPRDPDRRRHPAARRRRQGRVRPRSRRARTSASRATSCSPRTARSSPRASRRTTTTVAAGDGRGARPGLSVQLEAFAANTMEYMKRERALLLDGVGVPDVATAIEGRHVAGRRPRLRLQGGPAGAAPLHPRLPAGAHRRRRRRRRAASRPATSRT